MVYLIATALPVAPAARGTWKVERGTWNVLSGAFGARIGDGGSEIGEGIVGTQPAVSACGAMFFRLNHDEFTVNWHLFCL